MTKISVFAALLLIFAMASIPTAPHAWAAEGTPASDAKGDTAKSTEASKDGGGEKKKSNEDVMGGRFAGDPVYVRLPPIVLPILGNTGPEQLVTIQITVEVKDFDAADDMHNHLPRVMDALIQALYGGLSSGDLRDGRVADAEKIKNKAMSALQKAQGPDSIKEVLIVNMSQRLL